MARNRRIAKVEFGTVEPKSPEENVLWINTSDNSISRYIESTRDWLSVGGVSVDGQNLDLSSYASKAYVDNQFTNGIFGNVSVQADSMSIAVGAGDFIVYSKDLYLAPQTSGPGGHGKVYIGTSNSAEKEVATHEYVTNAISGTSNPFALVYDTGFLKYGNEQISQVAFPGGLMINSPASSDNNLIFASLSKDLFIRSYDPMTNINKPVYLGEVSTGNEIATHEYVANAISGIGGSSIPSSLLIQQYNTNPPAGAPGVGPMISTTDSYLYLSSNQDLTSQYIQLSDVFGFFGGTGQWHFDSSVNFTHAANFAGDFPSSFQSGVKLGERLAAYLIYTMSAGNNPGAILTVSDKGYKPVYSDGTIWRYVHDNSPLEV